VAKERREIFLKLATEKECSLPTFHWRELRHMAILIARQAMLCLVPRKRRNASLVDNSIL
jgi:hypothetical protein